MAGGLRENVNDEGFYLQLHSANSGDLLWGGSKSLKSRKRKASPEFFPVERLISKRKVRNTVGNFKLYLYTHLKSSCIYSILTFTVDCKYRGMNIFYYFF